MILTLVNDETHQQLLLAKTPNRHLCQKLIATQIGKTKCRYRQEFWRYWSMPKLLVDGHKVAKLQKSDIEVKAIALSGNCLSYRNRLYIGWRWCMPKMRMIGRILTKLCDLFTDDWQKPIATRMTNSKCRYGQEFWRYWSLSKMMVDGHKVAKLQKSDIEVKAIALSGNCLSYRNRLYIGWRWCMPKMRMIGRILTKLCDLFTDDWQKPIATRMTKSKCRYRQEFWWYWRLSMMRPTSSFSWRKHQIATFVKNWSLLKSAKQSVGIGRNFDDIEACQNCWSTVTRWPNCKSPTLKSKRSRCPATVWAIVIDSI